MANYNESEGVWRTIRGRRVFIRKGQSLDEAMKESGKFKNEPNTGKSTRAEVKDKIQKHIRDYYENDEDLVRDMDAAADPRKDFTSWAKGERLVEGGSFLIANADMNDELNSWGINPQNKEFSSEKSYQTYKSLMGREMGKIYDKHKEYQLYKQAKENPNSIDPMTENSTNWEALDRKYKSQYATERTNKIASNNGYKVGDKVQIQDEYSGKYFGEYEVTGELDKDKSQMLYGNAVKGYTVKDTKYGTGEISTNDYRMKKIESDIPESMLKNSKELSDIAKRTGGTSLTSEAGRKWDKLYKENKNNVAYDLGDNYSAKLGYSGGIQIQSSHPYDETDYSWATANIKNGKIKDWKVTIPGGGTKIVKSKNEALNLMKNGDEWITSGKQVRNFEGIKGHHSPTTSFEEFMKKKKSNNGK